MDLYTEEELEAMPTISSGHTCNLKVDTGQTRVWLSRCGPEDGLPENERITYERLRGGRWITVGHGG